jgi:membrane protein YqaA with SNARE-associated domain
MKIRSWIWAIGLAFVGYSQAGQSATHSLWAQLLGALIGALIGFAIGYAVDEYFTRNSRRL